MAHDVLRQQHDNLLEQYDRNLDLLDDVQRDIKESFEEKFGGNAQQKGYLDEWLSDKGSLFRILRRHNFDRDKALDACLRTLSWRAQRHDFEDLALPIPIELFQCIPWPSSDFLGNPLLFLRLPDTSFATQQLKLSIMNSLELLRRYLHRLNDKEAPHLQFVWVLDLDGVSVRHINWALSEIAAWYFKDIGPHYPYLCGAVYVINYSWVYLGAWSFLKNILPASAIARVHFISAEQILDYIPQESLPRDYGGSLPSLKELDNPLAIKQSVKMNRRGSQIRKTSLPSIPIPISRLSALNPYFGYPAENSNGKPSPRGGQRHIGDLLRTLTVLFWLKWRRKGLYLSVVVGLCWLSLRLWRRWARPLPWRTR
ncbi:CRAL/TRIO domain-containing protein [Sistotremastrum suecicum HHB10207 ss-3]|uniref:CRAL/TRIO domain-containing protein n=1 Tax=Sistotremastrum suecicum HHB10207 ss-3 TaxID=1314776 RepID=A0A166GAH5_9AGAM|nr:CRAL/TRIO domain-containing protein [Sistotremastrum suecicum HHB10207 ss-3]